MKTDNYLTLCLEQAAKSPLHYRHGAIVVRGGKVIGTGYNAYKPGFDGGALKTGRVAKAGDGELKALKLKMKALKQKDKNQQHQQDHPQQQSKTTFVPVETTSRGSGGGPNANVPLSMHSEMMAIHSALAASSTLSSTAFSREKPCFKLPSGDKCKSRLRADVLRAYVAQVKLERDNDNNSNEEENLAGSAPEETDSAFHLGRSGVKHHWKKDWKGKHQNKPQYEGTHHRQYEYEVEHGQQQQPQPQPSACKASGKGGRANVIRGYDATKCDVDDPNDHKSTIPTNARSAGTSGVKHGRDSKRSRKMRFDPPQPTPQHMLLPAGRTGEAGHSVTERKRHPRLQGADLYVTRLGWSGTPEIKEKKKKRTAAPVPPPVIRTTSKTGADSDLSESISSLSSLSISSTDPSSPSGSSSSSTSGEYASLHEEYLANNPTPHRNASCCDAEAVCGKPPVSASRPCYRCISFMHAVGIRRVFWTNDSGEWEGGKVKDLVDSMDGVTTEGANGGGGPMGNGVFVTKHEVLMMRRIMGAQKAADSGGGTAKRK